MRKKHRNDYNHGKNGYVTGNPRYGKSRGSQKPDRKADRLKAMKLEAVASKPETEEERFDREEAARLDAEYGQGFDPYADCNCGLCSYETYLKEKAEYEAEYPQTPGE